MWPESAVTTLREMWSEGFSAALIAEKLGTSRNAVIGKAHRLHLEERRQSGTKIRKPQTHNGGRRRAAPIEKIENGGSNLAIFNASPRVRKLKTRPPELSKNELRAMFAKAWANTSKL